MIRVPPNRRPWLFAALVALFLGAQFLTLQHGIEHHAVHGGDSCTTCAVSTAGKHAATVTEFTIPWQPVATTINPAADRTPVAPEPPAQEARAPPVHT